jgi:hypothetical protein
MQDTQLPLTLTATQLCKTLNISRTILARLCREKKLTPLLHIKKSYRLFDVQQVKDLLKPKN